MGLVCLLFLGCFDVVYAKTYDINAYGAEADGKTLNTAAIQKAVNACTPGDTVLIPAGRYVTGTLHLKSNITLYIEKESTLVGSARPEDYEIYVVGYATLYNGIFSTTNAENVSIAGGGIINGGGHPQSMIIFSGCKGVAINNVSLLNSSGAALSLVSCERVSVSGIKIESSLQSLSASGIQLIGCRQLTVKGSGVQTGGDAIAVSGFLNFRTTQAVSSQNIVISNCSLQSSSTAIDIQSLDQSSIAGVEVSYTNILPSGRGVGIMLRNAGSLYNITFNNVYIESKLGFGSQETNGEPIHISAVAGADSVKLGVISNVAFNNVFCVGENQILLYGSAQSMLKNIQFNDVVFNIRNSVFNATMGGNILLWGNADKEKRLFAGNLPAIMATYIQGLNLNNIKLNWADAHMPAYFTAGIGVSNFKEIKLNRCDVKPAPLSRNSHAIELFNGSLATVDAGDVSRVSVQDIKPVRGNLKPQKAKTLRK